MTSYTEEKKLDLISKMIETAKTRSTSAEEQTLLPFLAHYYAHSGAELVTSRSVADLLATAVSHWKFAGNFSSGTPLVRVYNPTLDEHGWTSRHTVIEIVNDDMPFLVDSVTMEINRLGFALRAAIHPVFQVWRDADGQAVRIRTGFEGKNGQDDSAAGKPRAQSFIHFEIDRSNDAAQLAELEKGIARILADVRLAVVDWPATMDVARKCTEELNRLAAGNGQQAEFTEARAFLDWLVGGNFIFLGYRDYRLEYKEGQGHLVGQIDSGLGILRGSIPRQDPASTRLPAGADRIINAPSPVFLTKADARSTVHRPGHLDYVGIKQYDANGKVVGEHRFLGLYTSGAYVHKPADIPLVRRKVEKVIGMTDFVPNGHLAKAFKTILDDYPRDELLQIDEHELHNIAIGILRLEERQQTRLFARRDVLGRYVSCLIFVPREKYTTDLRVKIQNILLEAFNGVSAEFTPLLSESVLARLHITIYAQAGGLPDVDLAAVEKAIVAASYRWIDSLNDSLAESHGEEKGLALLRRYSNAFPGAFQEDYSAATTVLDIDKMESLTQEGTLAMALYRPNGVAATALRLKLYRVGNPITLSHSLPTLEHMGVKVNNERPYRIGRAENGPVWMHDFDLETANGAEVDIAQVKAVFEDTFAHVWNGDAENDDLNRLTLLAQMPWRDVVVLRAYAKYLRQVGSTFSNAYVEQALISNPAIARQLAHLFEIRFNPDLAGDRAMQSSALLAEIETALREVSSLDVDRILRQFLGLILATLRTNFYQSGDNGQPHKPWVSFKFNPAEVPGLPDPKPMFEIWVYSPQVEGVHLRGGKVARGGLRWSDRREDFRTEVLGLVKAQMVKNAVIVPVGSKGCFVVKNPPPVTDRDAYLAEGIACYRTFLRGLLDVTDNLINGEVIPPQNVVRHDADDPYLVVAADKGTATFSDYANALSQEYGFWLGDAFASGGSVGYDHKKMAITARGAWESVKRHFWQNGVDTQKEAFTVVGVGDMSGDVFGNGMLLSNHIRLQAAFDHRHIFLDPNPDTAVSFAERKRLYDLPRSSWADYDASLITSGGGVYPRTAKSIPLSAQMASVLGLSAGDITPIDLMRAILLAPVDLLYNGGIGTYVKSTRETNLQVGDRANDNIRINGAQLRAKVVAEGGNLGFTQLGRIEFAQKGGLVFTDAIDNSAGVDCSDHEVNIKILLNALVVGGKLNETQRNAQLAEMTEEVGLMVLTDNYYQGQMLTLMGRRAKDSLDSDMRLIRYLERSGRLNRPIEFLPSDEEVEERKLKDLALTAPEHAVLLAYSKMWVYQELLDSTLPDSPMMGKSLVAYFPKVLGERYAEEMERHPLKREIIATYQTNTLINRAGPTFIHRLLEETDRTPAEIVRAMVIAREAFGIEAIWNGIDRLDHVVTIEQQASLLLAVEQLLERVVLWLLRHPLQNEALEQAVTRLRTVVSSLGSNLTAILPAQESAELEKRQNELVQTGVPLSLAAFVVGAEHVGSVLNIAEIATATRRSLDLVARIYFMLDLTMKFGALHAAAAALAGGNHWRMLARSGLQNELTVLHRALVTDVLSLSPELDDPARLIEVWQEHHKHALRRYAQLITEMEPAKIVDISMLTVLVGEMRLVKSTPLPL